MCQPFVLSLSKETAGILRTGLSKHFGLFRSWFDQLTTNGL